MRVLHLDSGREMGGGQWQVLRLIEGLSAAGVESGLLAPFRSPLFNSAWERVPTFPLSLRKAVTYARGYDLVHAHDARTHTMAAVVKSAPLIVSRRVAFAVRSRWKYTRAVHYVAVSEFAKVILMEGGVPPEKISVVYDGVPLLDVTQGGGLLSPEKGAPVALEAARLAGKELKISTDLQNDLMNAGVFVYVTECEGLGSGVLLAMSAGVPVVASRVGGLTEIIRDGENGLLVENHVEDIAAAIRRLADDREFAARLGAAGRRTVIERFTVEQMVRHTMEVYRQVLG